MTPTLSTLFAFASGCVLTAAVAWLVTRRPCRVVLRQSVPVLVFVPVAKRSPAPLAARVVGFEQVEAAGRN